MTCQDAEFIDSTTPAGTTASPSSRRKDARAGGRLALRPPYPSRDIRIDNVTCDGSHGLTVGSEMSGGVEDVRFTNIRIYNSGPSVRIKSQCGRRSYVRNVLYENITADLVQNAVWIDMQYFSKATSCPVTRFHI